MSKQDAVNACIFATKSIVMETIQIDLHWKWLKYDIDQETQKSAKCLITNDTTGELTMEAQTADDEFDMDYCKRKITEACMKLQDVLPKFFEDIRIYDSGGAEISVGPSDTLVHTADKWKIELGNFGTRRNVNENLFANELHQYVVLYVLQEWCKMIHPTMEKNYYERMAAEEVRIKNIAFRKEAPTRPS